jgi:hypothetical protein
MAVIAAGLEGAGTLDEIHGNVGGKVERDNWKCEVFFMMASWIILYAKPSHTAKDPTRTGSQTATVGGVVMNLNVP